MRATLWFLGLAAALAGCASSENQVRVRECTEDGVHLFRKGAYREAKESFAAALSLKPGDPDILYNLGRCYDQQNETKQAEAQYLECLKHSPNHAECWHSLTAMRLRNGQKAEARRQVEEWLRHEPKQAGPYAEDGWLRLQDGDLIAARGRFYQALALDPKNNWALTELAEIYELQDRKDRALVLLERSLELNPDQPEVSKHILALRTQGAGRPRPD
jgi:Flp pilus assembly protein TadD